MLPCGALQVKINVIVSGNAHYYYPKTTALSILFCFVWQNNIYSTGAQKQTMNALAVNCEWLNWITIRSRWAFWKIGLYGNKFDNNNNSNFFFCLLLLSHLARNWWRRWLWQRRYFHLSLDLLFFLNSFIMMIYYRFKRIEKKRYFMDVVKRNFLLILCSDFVRLNIWSIRNIEGMANHMHSYFTRYTNY